MRLAPRKLTMLGWRQAFMKATSLLKLASWPGDTSMLAFSFLTATSNVVSSTALYTWQGDSFRAAGWAGYASPGAAGP